MVTGLNPNENVDPSRWTRFLASVNNTTITDKVLHGKALPRNLEEAMKKAIQLEAGFQLSEGVNMARQINFMQAEIRWKCPVTQGHALTTVMDAGNLATSTEIASTSTNVNTVNR